MSTRRSHVLELTCILNLQVCLSMYELLVDARRYAVIICIDLKINSSFLASWQCVFHHSNSLWLLAFKSKSGIGFVWSFLLKLLSFFIKAQDTKFSIWCSERNNYRSISRKAHLTYIAFSLCKYYVVNITYFLINSL